MAFAAAIDAMPLDMPESVLVRFSGALHAGQNLTRSGECQTNGCPFNGACSSVEKANKKNIFNGRIMEIEGLPDLKLEQAFELTDATAELIVRRLHHQTHRSNGE